MSDAAGVRTLDDPVAGDPALSGGKGAALVRLRAAGLTVPAGFVVVAAPPETAEVLAAERDAVAAAYAALGERTGHAQPLVAVRSSAVVEDGAQASAAGLLRTELGLRGVEELLAAIVRCRASGSGARVRAYLDRVAPGTPPGPVAVVVQVLVPARAAGVASTAHPVSGDRSVVVVEATPGLGPPAAEGRVVPEHLVLSRTDGRVVQRRAGRRGVVLVTEGERVLERSVDPADVTRDVLTDAEAATVARIALEVEAVLGRSADVEWALAEDGPEVWVLQGRPLTALPTSR